ncbi:hypothetical protein BHM03_00051149 [Ensete ventricosum]|nr:hypothetical protein BHM03_00051149 [Ensete ventricosum]
MVSQKNATVINFARSHSQVLIGFSCTVSEIRNTGNSQRISPCVKFRSVFRAPPRKFKILAIPDMPMSRVSISFSCTVPKIQIIGHSRKYVMVISFATSCVQSQVSIGFSCTISEIQNTGHSRRISPCEVIRARFHETNEMVINFARSRAQSGVSIAFSCTVSKIQNIGNSRCISPWEVIRAQFHEKCDSYKLCANRAQNRVRSVFRAPSQKFKILPIPYVLAHDIHVLSQKFKILAIPDILAQGKSYEHGFAKNLDSQLDDFMKKHNGHKFCLNRAQSRVRSVFRASSQKFKILVIPDVLAQSKSYEHGFTKKLHGHKLCAKCVSSLREVT